MLNNFISGIVAMFFWGKTSSKTLEKTLNASWLRTFIYGFLTFVVSVFFYKTYQVATVYNMIQIDGIRQSCDSTGLVVDTVKDMCIIHRLAENSMQQGDLQSSGTGKFSNDKKVDEILSRYGGVYGVIKAPIHPHKFQQRKYEGWDEKFQLDFEMYLDKHNIPHQKVNHLYNLSYLATNIPSFIPFYPKVDRDEELGYIETHIFSDFQIHNTRNNPEIDFADHYSKNKEKAVLTDYSEGKGKKSSP